MSRKNKKKKIKAIRKNIKQFANADNKNAKSADEVLNELDGLFKHLLKL